jgi:ELWxxDGT repeat protein
MLTSVPGGFPGFGASLAANGKLFFEGGINAGDQLWVTDGTVGGTQKLTDALVSDSGNPLVVAGQTVFFEANDGTHGWQLWKSNGTPAPSASPATSTRPAFPTTPRLTN